VVLLGASCSGSNGAGSPDAATSQDGGADDGGEDADAAPCTPTPPPSGANVYFVSPSGSDSNPGTLASPWATIGHAQQAVQAAARSGPITVVLRGGTYSTTTSLAFGSADSGTAGAPITWQAYSCETPVVSGGMRVTGWTNPSGNLWQVTLPASTAALESLYYNGERRLRARVQAAAGIGYVMQNGACAPTAFPGGGSAAPSDCNLGTFLRVASEVAPGTTGCPSMDNGKGASKCLDRFEYAQGDPIAQWANLNGTYTGDPSHPCQPGASNAYPAGDVEVDLFDAWTVDVMRVGCVDTANRIVYFTGPTYAGGGNVYNFFGPTTGHRYIVENARDAFDAERTAGQTGIWFLDRSASPWVLSYVAGAGENPSTDVVVAPQAPSPMIDANQLQFVAFRGITFEMDDYVPGAGGFNADDNGENALPGAIACEACANVTFDGVMVRHTAASGLQIGGHLSGAACGLPQGGLGGPACVVVENSAFYDLGDSGIHVGHAPNGSDTDDEVAQFVLVQNNVVQGYSRVFADGEGFAQGSAHDILYTHNDIDDGYHAGISICKIGCPSKGGGAFNVVSSYNRIWNLMQGITSDGGSLYYNTGAATKTAAGNQVLHNIVHDTTDASILDKVSGVIDVAGSGYGGHGIYLDNQTGGVTVAGNVVYRMSGITMWISGGPGPNQPSNTISNNVFAYGRQAMFDESASWLQGCGVMPALRATVDHNVFYFDRDDTQQFSVMQGCAYSCGLPFNQFESFAGNLYWRTDGAFASYGKQFHVQTTAPADPTTCGATANGWSYLTFAQWQDDPTVSGTPVTMSEDMGGAIGDPHFANPAHPGDDYTLASPPVQGFDPAQTNDTLQHAGRTNPLVNPPVVPRTFPTYGYDPGSGF